MRRNEQPAHQETFGSGFPQERNLMVKRRGKGLRCQEGMVTSEGVWGHAKVSPGEMARTLPAVTARERDLRDDGWSPTRRNPRGAESAAGRPGSSGNRKSGIGPESWPDLQGFFSLGLMENSTRCSLIQHFLWVTQSSFATAPQTPG